MNNIFFTSDTHFSHQNIIKFCNRPFSDAIEMNEALIQNWNFRVKPNDIVYHLGDFAFDNYFNIKEILKRLNGKKHLVLGNHDNEIVKNKQDLLNNKLFESIEPYAKIKWNKQDICLFHYGCRVWDKSHSGSWQLFGHSHNSLPPYGKSVDVGVDSTWVTGKAEYKPFSFDEVKLFMDTQS